MEDFGGVTIRSEIMFIMMHVVLVEDFGGAKICYELYGNSQPYGTLYSGHYTADVKHLVGSIEGSPMENALDFLYSIQLWTTAVHV